MKRLLREVWEMVKAGPVMPSLTAHHIEATARLYQPRDEREFCPLFLTLNRRPGRNEEFYLVVRGQEVPRDQYQILENLDTGQIHVRKPDATWGECMDCGIRFRPMPRHAAPQTGRRTTG